MKDYNKNKESTCLKCWDLNNLYESAMPQKFPVNGLKCVEETSGFNEDFIKSYNEEIDGGYFLEADIQYSKKYMTFTMIYHFFPRE